MRSRFHQRTGSLLALLAMLLITFAPVVSQLIATHAQADELTAELCSAHATASQAPAGHHEPDAFAHFNDSACGYCHFFAHAPAVSDARAPAALEVPARQTVAIAPVLEERPDAPFTTARSRAPPVLI